jgi:hypothetical protein
MKNNMNEIHFLLWSQEEKKQFYQNLRDGQFGPNYDLLSLQEEQQLYLKLYDEQLCLYNQKEVSKYCHFPFDKSYTEEALKNLIQWINDIMRSEYISTWELDPDQLNGLDIGPCPTINASGMWYYFNTFNEEVKDFGNEFLDYMGTSYDYSEENINRIEKWRESPRRNQLIEKKLGFSVSVHKVSNKPEGGYYTDDEDGVMSALAHGDGDFFGL